MRTIPKLTFIVILFFLFSLPALTKNRERDSLLNLLNKHKVEDTIRVNLLIEIAETYYLVNQVLSKPFLMEAINISEKINYPKGLVYGYKWYCEFLSNAGKNDSILILVNKIKELSIQKNYEDGILMAKFIQGVYISDILKQINTLKSIEPDIVILNRPLSTLELYFRICLKSLTLKDTATTIEYLRKAIALIPEISSKTIQANIIETIGNGLSTINFANNLEIGREYIDRSIEMYKDLDDEEGLLTLYAEYSNINLQINNFSVALEYCFKALDLLEKNKTLRFIDEKISSSTNKDVITNICWTYYLLDDYSKALKFGKVAYRLGQDQKNKASTAYSALNLGLIYEKIDSLKSAHYYLDVGLKLGEELKQPWLIGWSYIGMGKIEDKQSNSSGALGYYQKAIANLKLIGNKEDISYAYLGIAKYYSKVNEFSEAIAYADSALRYSVNIAYETITVEKDATEILYNIYASQKNYSKAYAYLLLNKQMIEKLKKEEANKHTMLYDFEQIQREQSIAKEKEDLLKEQKLKRSRYISYSFIGGFAILLVIAGLILRNYKLKQRAYKLLAQQKKVIEEQNEELNQKNEILNQQNEEILSQRDEIEAQRDNIKQQKDILSTQNENIKGSIMYAQRIQSAVFPPVAYINEILPDNFILFKPKDIVSGDFYWIKQVNQYIMVIVADCTGHGIPGAFMSILSISLLNEIINLRKITQPSFILNELRTQIKRSLRQVGNDSDAKDGVDLAICLIDQEKNRMEYSGAYNPLVMVRNNEIIEYKGDRMPVSISYKEKESFTNHEISVSAGDTFYLFTDGYQDQIGGIEGKKFMKHHFEEKLLQIHNKSMLEQHDILDTILLDWKKGSEQTDDILVVGFRL